MPTTKYTHTCTHTYVHILRIYKHCAKLSTYIILCNYHLTYDVNILIIPILPKKKWKYWEFEQGYATSKWKSQSLEQKALNSKDHMLDCWIIPSLVHLLVHEWRLVSITRLEASCIFSLQACMIPGMDLAETNTIDSTVHLAKGIGILIYTPSSINTNQKTVYFTV